MPAKALRQFLASVLALAFACPSALAQSDRGYVLAVHPFLPAQQIQRRFSPLADHLTRVLGLPVQVRVGQDYQEHLDFVGRDRADLAFIGPAGFVTLKETYGDKPILAAFEVGGQHLLYGVIAVREGSTIASIENLAGKHIAFGDQHSTMSHLVPRSVMQAHGVCLSDLAGYRYLGSHTNVAMAVLAGDADAGAMKREVFDRYARNGLKALTVTPGVPDHLFVARSNLPGKRLELLRRELQSLHLSESGRELLAKLHKGLTRLRPAAAADYRALGEMLGALERPSD